MSRNPTLVQQIAAQKATASAALIAKNKEAARMHLLQIQLILAKRPIPQK